MDSGVTAQVPGLCRGIAFLIFTVTSAYLVLELVIALSAQGEPTTALAPFTGAEIVYPMWYQAAEFLDAVRIAMIAYPVTAVFYGLAMLTRLGAQAAPVEQPRLPAVAPVPEAMTSVEAAILPATPEAIDDLCVVSADRQIQHITPSTARLFGLTPADMLGQSLEVFVAPVGLPKLDALVAAAYADRPRAFATTVRIILADGVVVPVDITCSAEVDGVMAGPGTAILMIRPFSDRGRLDDQLAALWY
jgi:PAS domain S-box-containing protein